MNRHPLDLLCLGSGVMFTLFALGYLLIPASMNVAVIIPAMLVGLGLFGILAAVVAQGRNQQEVDSI